MMVSVSRGATITEEQLRQYKAQKLSDDAIAALHGVSRDTIKRRRKQLGVPGMAPGEALPAYCDRIRPPHCQNPQCGRVAKSYKLGLCNACYEWQRTRGTQRIPQREWTRQQGQWCSNCHNRRAYSQSLCVNCYCYKKANGRNRPRYRWAESCKVCGRPREYRTFRKGRCRACADHWYRHGVERPAELIAKIAPFGWCDCGQKAVHPDVPLRVMTVDRQVVHTETYNLCQACYDLENEPLQTKGEAVWNK